MAGRNKAPADEDKGRMVGVDEEGKMERIGAGQRSSGGVGRDDVCKREGKVPGMEVDLKGWFDESIRTWNMIPALYVFENRQVATAWRLS